MRSTVGKFLKAAGSRIRSAWNEQAGFTIIEMLTVFLVIGVLAVLILVNTQTGNRRQELRDSAGRFVTHVRNVEARAAAAEPVPDDDGDSVSRKAYGICVSSTATTDPCQPPASGFADEYQLYARNVNDTNYSQRPTDPSILQTVTLPEDVELSTSIGWLDYLPPQPSMLVIGSTADRSVNIRQKGITNCAGSPDCVTVLFRPKSGAVYVQ